VSAKALQFSTPCKLVMTNSEYHSFPAAGSSSLKNILRSPAHYLEGQKPSEPTPAQEFGSAVHEALLEPNLFEANTVVMPRFEGKGSVGAREDWRLANHGKRILKAEDMDAIKEILKSVSSHKTARSLLTGGAAEESYFDQCPETGLVRKVRPDFLRQGHMIVDVKTTEDASADTFMRSVAKYMYHLSAAYYLDVVSNVMGQNFDQFIILAVEKKPPYGVAVYLLDEGAIDAGRFLYQKALKTLKGCKDTGIYPGYPDRVLSMSIPPWAFPHEEI
jgi:hypothetical protein